mgnify:CR=1 FL=1
MAKQKFTAPQGNPYNSIIQSTEQQQPEPAAKTEYYRFNAKFPMECKDYLQEMAWRATVREHRNVTITEYLTRVIRADMDAHPEWKETVDALNR